MQRQLPLLALSALLFLFPSCARGPGRAQADWKGLEEQGRIVEDKATVQSVMERERYTWSDGTVALQAMYERHPMGKSLRLTTELNSPQSGSGTPFVVDTGSSSSWLSWGAPLAQGALVSKQIRCVVAYGTQSSGHGGYVPDVSLGPLRGTDLPIALREQNHSLGSPSNVLGFPHFFHTQMEHTDGQWLLRSGTDRAAVIPAGWRHVSFIPGLPLVRIVDPTGRETIALLDTGAPENYALQGAPRGTYSLRTSNGQEKLEVPALKTGPWPVATLYGYRVTMLIGMDWLASRDWRMTFDKATWAFAP